MSLLAPVLVVSTTTKIKARYARRLPDPVFGKAVEHHEMWVDSNDLPPDLPLHPNPRAQNLNLMVYRDVRDSFLNEGDVTPNTFHLKNHGLDIVAKYVKRVDDDVYEIGFGLDDGILNGAHTYRILLDNRRDDLNQYVRVRIATGIEPDFITEMAGGLNTSVQVHRESLLNQAGRFDWIREELADEPYAPKIAYRENENKPVDIRDLLCLMTMFNIDLYPNDGEEFPIIAYSSKAGCLQRYDQNEETYRKMRPILRDILHLTDYVNSTACELHNKAGGKAGALSFVETRTRIPFSFVFAGKTDDKRVSQGALYPMLGAFRWFVVPRGDNEFGWRTPNGYRDVRGLWRKYGARMMAICQGAAQDLGRNPTKMGKSKNLWSTLYSNLLGWYLRSTS